MRIAVAGGTGTVGRHVVTALLAAGHDPVVLTRSSGTDLTTRDDLRVTLAGVDVVIDVSNRTTVKRRASVEFFTTVTRNLLTAGRSAGVGHYVALSIVGIDRVDLGYYEGKRRQEQLLLNSDEPATVLRATQFHEFVSLALDQMPGPLAVVPTMRTQPVAAVEVAAQLVALAEQPPAGMAPDLAGPREEHLTDLARRLLRARGSRRRVLPIRFPGSVGRGWATGALLPTTPGPRGSQTFDEWLGALGDQ